MDEWECDFQKCRWDEYKFHIQQETDNIKFSKNQQWKVLHLTIIANATLILALKSVVTTDCSSIANIVTKTYCSFVQAAFIKYLLFLPSVVGVLYLFVNFFALRLYRVNIVRYSKEFGCRKTDSVPWKTIKEVFFFQIPFLLLMGLSAFILYVGIFPGAGYCWFLLFFLLGTLVLGFAALLDHWHDINTQ